MAIESLLKDSIYKVLPKRGAFNAKQTAKYVEELQSRAAIDLAARLGVLNKTGHAELVRLNTLRNKIAHNWMLHTYRMPKQGGSPSRKRQYRVEFNGKNLLNPTVMKEEFIPLYANIYLEFYAVNNGLRWKRHYIPY